MKKLVFILTILFIKLSTNAQYINYPISSMVTESDLIIEGKVIGQNCYQKNGLIYTANQIEICKVLHGSVTSKKALNIITYGGQLNEIFTSWSHKLKLHLNEEGIFFLTRNTTIAPEDTYSFEVIGQEQGFINYTKDNNGDFVGYSLFYQVENIESYIAQISTPYSQNSCILEDKSGLLVNIDDVNVLGNKTTISSSIKGEWSKTYHLEQVILKIQFSTPTNLLEYGFKILSANPSLESNYDLLWNQPNNYEVDLKITKKNNSNAFFEVNQEFQPFFNISFINNLLYAEIEDVRIKEASYKQDGNIVNVQNLTLLNGKEISDHLSPPDILTFGPLEVCAGIKMNESLGNPVNDGFVIIRGENFGDIAPSDIDKLIPNDYRVEFAREQSIGSSGFKVTPLPEDYDYWTDKEIRVRVPTAGWLVNNNNIISGPEPSVAVTGGITVRNPDGADSQAQDQEQQELIINFAHFNSIDAFDPNGLHSISRKLINRSGNGGYFFIFDDSFNNLEF